MAIAIELDSVWHGYWGLVHLVREQGLKVSPRGEPTRELPGVQVITSQHPTFSLPTGCGRNLTTALGVAEALQLIAGESHPDLLCRIAPAYERFMENDIDGGGIYQHGAYGPRAGWQMPYVIDKLRDDEHTRQAIIGVWQPDKDVGVDSPDIPCTVNLGFHIRRSALHLTAVMRSNDVWLGFPYDAFQFTQLQLTVARALGRVAGTYTHVTYSLHLYERDVDAALDLHLPEGDPGPEMRGVGRLAGQSWEYYAQRASQLLRGELPAVPTPTECLMHKSLERFMR